MKTPSFGCTATPADAPKTNNKHLNKTKKIMLQTKAGTIAGVIYEALVGQSDGLSFKAIKKATKLTEKDFMLGLGWLLREDKLNVVESGDEKDPFIYSLK